jgi:hypothetical protein
MKDWGKDGTFEKQSSMVSNPDFITPRVVLILSLGLKNLPKIS